MSKHTSSFIRIGLLWNFLLMTAISPSVLAQTTPPDSIWTFEQIRTDLDNDKVPDFLGDTVTVTGIANINSGILHEKFLQAFIQNDSSGMSIFSEEIETPFQVGDSLVLSGYIDQYNGLVEVQVSSYTVLPATNAPPAPKPLNSVVKSPARYLGMMAEGTGSVIEKGTTFNGKYVIISLKETGNTIMVYVSNFHIFYEDFNFGLLREGDAVNVKGIITEYNPEFPDLRTYKLFLRTPADLEYESLPRFYWYLILSILAVTILVAVGWVIVLRKRVNAKTQEIQKSLTEKETLLREIHHRVKNSLAIVSGLIELQLGSTDSEEAKTVLQDSQNRINSIGLIHEKLYQTESLADVDLGNYLKDLVNAIDSTFSEQGNITINFDLDSVKADPDKVIPCGLLMSELVVNAFKHAYKNGDQGKLDITLKNNNGSILLKVSDNGPGLPDDFDINKTDSLGSMLISSFTDQLGAEMNIDSQEGKGTTFTFEFPLN